GTPEGTIIPFTAFVSDGTRVRAYGEDAVVVSNRPDITVDAINNPFGDVTVGASANKTVTITNDGNADLNLGAIAVGNPVAAPFSILNDTCSSTTLAPAGNCNLTVRFSPAVPGAFSDSFDIPSNDPDENPVTVSVSGTGVSGPEPDITFTPLNHGFGNVTLGDSATQTITVKNDGDADLVLATVTLVNTSSPFSMQNDTCSGQILAPAASCVFDIRFAPIAVGAFNGSFGIPSNDPDENPVTVEVSGTGVAVPVPDIAVSDSVAPGNDLQVPFGGATVGGTSDQTVTVTNDGKAPLNLNTVAFADGLVVPFSILNDTCSGTSLVSAGNCTLTVRFSPTVVGAFNDTFDIPSNDPDEDPVIVSVSGTGLTPPAPDITVTDSVVPVNDLQVPFGSTTVGTNSDKTVTVTNDGNASLNLGAIAASNPVAAPFSILNDNCSGITLAPAGNCSLTVKFSPLATGLFNDSFDIPSNDPDTNSVTVNVSGTGVSAPVNRPPTAPELVFPEDGGTVSGPNVDFGWNRSTDPDGDAVTYKLTVCEDAALTLGCITESNIAALQNKVYDYAGLSLGFGLVFGFVIIGRANGRNKTGLLIVAVLFSGALLASCGGGGGNGGGNPTADITRTVNALKSGTTYHWKVTAGDGNGGATDSISWTFTTQ
ncbi:MAG: choice-of-anchor D domain-containing protein, partial [Nitrospiria bacterium]